MDLIVSVLHWIAIVIFWVTIAVSGLLFLRVILTWLGVNPFSRIPYHLTHITEPMVRPMRYQLRGGYMRYDLIPLVTGIMVLVAGLFIYSVLGQFAGIIDAISKNIMYGGIATRVLVAEIISLVGLLLVIAIFLRFFLPLFGVGYYNKFFRFLFVITDPIIKPIMKPLRRFLVAGMFDFSPLIAMFIVQLLTAFVARLVAGG